MSYCDYNPKLFKEFVSMKTKIKPQLSSTWTLKAEQYRKLESCTLSNEEGVKIADISIKRLLQLMKEQNVSLIGDRLIGNFIIGNDRSLYTEEMYNTWKEKFEERISTEIPITELVEGHLYKTVCGSTLLYLGKRWTVNVSVKEGNFKVGKPTSSHYCIPYFDPNRSWHVSPAKINQKTIQDLGVYEGIKYKTWEEDWVKSNQEYGFGSGYTIVHVAKDKPDMNNIKLEFLPKNKLYSGGRSYEVVTNQGKMFLAKGNGYYGNRSVMSEIVEDSLEFPIRNREVDSKTLKAFWTFYLILN